MCGRRSSATSRSSPARARSSRSRSPTSSRSRSTAATARRSSRSRSHRSSSPVAAARAGAAARLAGPGGIFWTNQWLALRDETLDPPLLLAAHEADTALPAGLLDFLAPISISFGGDSCGVPVDCHDNDSYERLLLEFAEAGDVVLVPDRTRADVGDYRVIVNYARRHHDLHQMAGDCPNPTDPVPLYFQGLALRRDL
ncbi:hypothetical protein [Nannocystis pusilla]|uniref:hypothetical protein n=1 Tax=Nannocystis pusilla TaxID=889268 RepID=UPI003B76A56E